MTILRWRVRWKRVRPADETRRSYDLTPQETANARAAIRFIRARVGGGPKLAAAIGATAKAIEKACGSNSKPSAGMMIRVVRLVGVSVEDVLAGRWPVAEACPHCGRTAPARAAGRSD
jgi:hypothetical protein